MQTLTLQVQDSFIPNLLNFLNQYQDKVIIQKDENLDLDPYFYKRQQRLHKIRDDVKNGNVEMKSHKQIWSTVKKHLKTIK